MFNMIAGFLCFNMIQVSNQLIVYNSQMDGKAIIEGTRGYYVCFATC